MPEGSGPKLVIVGGGPAGLATALFLAHAAPELTPHVLVLEKERYPRDKFCAGAIGARADKLLARIGVTIDVPSVPLDRLTYRAAGRSITVREPGFGRVVRRLEFDAALARVARERGLRLIEGEPVIATTLHPQGMELQTRRACYRPRVVVGADGVGSIIRRGLGMPFGEIRAQVVEVDTPPTDGDTERDTLLFDTTDRTLPGYTWAFPTQVDGRPLVCRGVYLLKNETAEALPSIEALLDRELRSKGLDPRSYPRKRFAERGFCKREAVSRPGVLLVGEAAGIDGVTGEGIAQAIAYGAAAGRYLAEKWRAQSLDLSDWGRASQGEPVGRDLRARARALPLFYGPHRAAIETFILGEPKFLQAGMRHFAGNPWSRVELLGVACRGLTHTLGAVLRR